MCIRDRRTSRTPMASSTPPPRSWSSTSSVIRLSLIHISEPTRLRRISYAVFCLKKIRRPPRSTPLYSSAASDVYKRQEDIPYADGEFDAAASQLVFHFISDPAVSYTHLRAHETKANLVCRLLLEKNTATTEIYTSLFVGSVRCV